MNKHLTGDRTPFTYLIGWSEHRKYYYGVRYCKDCHPKDLWVKYKTSSALVKRFYNKHGEPNIIQIRKTFKTKESALLWEGKVLRRIDAAKDDRFLNLRNVGVGSKGGPNIGQFRQGNKTWCIGMNLVEEFPERNFRKGYKHSEESKNLMSISTKNSYKNSDIKEKIRKKSLEQFKDPIKKEKHKQACLACNIAKDSVWINKNSKHKRIKSNEIQTYIELGWVRGRIVGRKNYINPRTRNSTGQFIKKDKINGN